MDDQQIVDLYWRRSERAISETAVKYGHYCFSVAYNVLANKEDAEESVNDTYLAAWDNLPPYRPAILTAFLGKLTRRLSINRWRERSAQKRGGGEIPLALEELDECIASASDLEGELLSKEVSRALNDFLETLPQTERDVFVRRYFMLDPIPAIASHFGFSQSKVASMLLRTRKKLRAHLEQEELI